MITDCKVVHLTAHLGGGVGKALSGLVTQAIRNRSRFRHTVVCLERPEKTQFLRLIEAAGGEVIVSPSPNRLKRIVAEADIVQLEWWNHPATVACLCSTPLPPMRLVVWCHISGLHQPRIPMQLINTADRVMFTSPCSLEEVGISIARFQTPERFSVVHSCGGFNGLPLPAQQAEPGIRAGYIGSLNFAKLHPQYVQFLSAVRLPGFRVKIIGDETNRAILEQQCADAGRPGLLDFRGYTDDIARELSSLNVITHILNPEHYGTTENALLEAMAMGIVPVVLDNPAERHIIDHLVTGLVVHSPREFGEAFAWLSDHPDDLRRIGRNAAKYVRRKFAVSRMYAALSSNYSSALTVPKHRISFTDIFGTIPADWFLANQNLPEFFTAGLKPDDINVLSLPGLLERTKGSVFHYHSHFPEDHSLQNWVTKLRTIESCGTR